MSETVYSLDILRAIETQKSSTFFDQLQVKSKLHPSPSQQVAEPGIQKEPLAPQEEELEVPHL
jgi:hypothetical protein